MPLYGLNIAIFNTIRYIVPSLIPGHYVVKCLITANDVAARLIGWFITRLNLSSQTTGQMNMPSGVFICPVGLSQGHIVLAELRLQKCGCVPLLVFVEIDRAKTTVTLNDLERSEDAL